MPLADCHPFCPAFCCLLPFNSAYNKALMFGLVQNEQEMASLTRIAVTLGAAMGQSAAKSIDDLSTALGRNSPLILDNLGISIKLEDSYRNRFGPNRPKLDPGLEHGILWV